MDGHASGHYVVASVCSSLQPLLMTAHERQQGPSVNPGVEFGPESQTPESSVSTAEGVCYPSTVSGDLVNGRSWRAFGGPIWTSG